MQCGFCATILLVSVPCSSLSRLVTVRCGHRCSGLLSVDMIKASFLPFHLLPSAGDDNDQGFQEKDQEICVEEVEKPKDPGLGDMRSPSMLVSNNSSGNEEEYTDSITVNHIVNKPPEKRQRAPSAYNRVIKEEIQRLKAENPSMAHKEAFSTAAKNWAQFDPVQYKIDTPIRGESSTQLIREDQHVRWNSDVTYQVQETAENFESEKPQGSTSIWARTPFE